jgi:uncharacterized protein
MRTEAIELDDGKGKAPSAAMRSLWIFLCLSAAASWTVWLWPFSQREGFYFTVFGLRFDLPFEATKSVIGICLPGIFAIAWAASGGRREILSLGLTLIRWRVPLKWYLLALIIPWCISWTALALVLLRFPSSHPRPSIFWFLQNLVLLLPFGPLFEELAWRGYAIRRLQLFHSEQKAALILGTFWAAWHIPLWLTTLGINRHTAAPVLILGFLSTLALSFVFSFIYNRSGHSLPVVILLHAAFDSSAAAIFPTVQSGQIYFIMFSAILSICVGAILVRSMARRFGNESLAV